MDIAEKLSIFENKLTSLNNLRVNLISSGDMDGIVKIDDEILSTQLEIQKLIKEGD